MAARSDFSRLFRSFAGRGGIESHGIRDYPWRVSTRVKAGQRASAPPHCGGLFGCGDEKGIEVVGEDD